MNLLLTQYNLELRHWTFFNKLYQVKTCIIYKQAIKIPIIEVSIIQRVYKAFQYTIDHKNPYKPQLNLYSSTYSMKQSKRS